MSVLTFLDHQSKLLKYLENDCYNWNGILLWHEMGTGKTISALGILMNYKNDIQILKNNNSIFNSF